MNFVRSFRGWRKTIGVESEIVSLVGSRILRSVHQVRTYAQGEAMEGFVARVPEQVDVKAIRAKLKLSQEGFARRFGFSLAAIRDWEQSRRQPEQAARVLLLVIDHAPDIVDEVLTSVMSYLTARPSSPSHRTRA